jgi:hypothetical protein
MAGAGEDGTCATEEALSVIALPNARPDDGDLTGRDSQGRTRRLDGGATVAG